MTSIDQFIGQNASIHASPGDKVDLIFTDSASVEIRCFVENPPPPGLKPCPSCGTYSVLAGTHRIEVDHDLYDPTQGARGRMIVDAHFDGGSSHTEINVVSIDVER